MKNHRRNPDPENELPTWLIVVAWLSGSWALGLAAFFFTLWLAAQGAE